MKLGRIRLGWLKSAVTRRRRFRLLLLSLFLSGCDIGGQLSELGSNIGDKLGNLFK